MKLEDLKGKEIEITSEGFLKVVKKKGKYIPSKWERYYFVDIYGGIVADINSGNQGPQWCVSHSQVFKTQTEAEEYKHYLETLDKYKYEFSDEEWEDNDIKKWVIKYFCDDKALRAICGFVCKYANPVYFKTVKDAQAFIEEAGEENVKKFMFDVWE